MNTRFITLFAALCLITVSALADSPADLRRRMEQRLPQIDALKSEEVLGENNRGFLEERKSGHATAGGLVADENRDREAVYGLIAKQTGATADSVGRARAKQIAGGSRSGVWVQEESGRWVKK